MLDHLIVLVGRSVKVKSLCSVIGLLISFGLAVGRLACFFKSFYTIQVVKVMEAYV